MPAIALVSITIALWAVERARGLAVKRQLLPIPALPQWLTLYIVPLPVPVIAGAFLGVAYEAFLPGHQPAAGALILLLCTIFLLSTVLTRVLSAIPAVFAGVLWLFFGFDASMPETTQYLTACVIVGALVCAVLWETLAARQRYVLGRVLVLIILAAALGTGGVLRTWQRTETSEQDTPWTAGIVGGLISPDHRSWVNCQTSDALTETTVSATVDYRHYTADLPSPALPLAWQGKVAALFLVWPARGAGGELRRWTFATNRWETLGTLAVPAEIRRPAMWGQLGSSPDGRYSLLLRTPSRLGKGVDCWAVDLHARRIVLAMPDVGYYDEHVMGLPPPVASWCADRVLLSGCGECISIDYATLHGQRVALPAERSAR